MRSTAAFTEEEVLYRTAEVLSTVGDVLPENNYWGFATYSMILPELFHVMLPQSPAISPLWNFLDAFCSIVSGGVQVTDKTTHRPDVTKVKGVVNIASGLQLTGTTAATLAGAGALGAISAGNIGFAAAFGAAFFLSLEEVVRCGRRLHNKNYWLKDSLSQIKKLDQLIPQLAIQISTMEDEIDKKKMGSKTLWAYRKALKQKIKRLKEYDENRKTLLQDVPIMMQGMEPRQIEEFYRKNPELQEPSGYFKVPILEKKKDESEAAEAALEARIKAIKKKAIYDFIEATANSVILGTAFAGMLLVCIPGLQIPGLIVVAIASAMYLLKNARRIPAFARSVVSFFKSESKEDFSHRTLDDKKTLQSEGLTDPKREDKDGPETQTTWGENINGDILVVGDEKDFEIDDDKHQSPSF